MVGRAPRLILVLLALLALACGPAQQTAVQGSVRLLVAPDDGAHALVTWLRGAEYSIDIMAYLLSSDEIVAELLAARRRGVTVRVLLEEDPVGGGERNRIAAQKLAAADIAVRWAGATFRFTHAKMMLADSARATIMTLNLTPSSLRSNREFAVLVEDPTVVRSLAELFQSDWERAPAPRPEPPLVVSPINARETLHELIRGARQSLEIYAPSLEDDAIAAAMAAAADRGVRVRLLTNPPTERDPYGDERALLRRGGGIVGFLSFPNVHAKVVVADGQRAFVGSQNFTATSLDQNREVGILIDDPEALRRLRQTFETDWAQATLERTETRRFAPAA